MKFRKLVSPINVQWELTPNCNYKCFHCYNYWRSCGSFSKRIKYSTVVEQIIENHIFKVTLTGGEPLLVFSEIKPYIEEMVKAGIKVSINTNASLLTQEMAEFFKENNIGLLISLPCCIPEINDKITTVKGSFDLTIAGIKLAKRNNLNICINMVVSKLNKDYIVDTAMFLHDELGINAINVTKAARPINGISKFDDYALTLQEFRKLQSDVVYIQNEFSMFVDSLTVYPICSCDSIEACPIFTTRKCFAGKTNVAIGYNGDVKACARDIKSYGNLKEKTLKECWDSMDNWRNIDVDNLPKECLDCNVKYSCQGGCRIDRCNEIVGKSYRDKNKLLITYESETETCFDYQLKEKFQVTSGNQFFDEDFGMRCINKYKDTFFITKEFHQFVINNVIFSKEELIEHFSISSEEANKTLSYLVEKKLIKQI